MNNLVEHARDFADRAHRAVNQTRKYTGEPYINHPTAVMRLLETHSSEAVADAQRAAALLHDTVEDTEVTIAEIEQHFGAEVAELVGWLTDVSRPDHGNRAARKAVDRAHTAAAPAEAQTIKLCDLISNTRSIVEHDEKFARTYLAEKRLLLEVMTKGDPTLRARALQQIG